MYSIHAIELLETPRRLSNFLNVEMDLDYL